MSDNEDIKRTKQQMIDDACSIVQDIQRKGKQDRTKINAIKTAALEHLDSVQNESQMADDASAALRETLIQKMGLAAQSGDFAEMQRLKKLLDETSKTAY